MIREKLYSNFNTSLYQIVHSHGWSRVAPWHWDITDDEKTLNETKEFDRYHCHISPPSDGHILIVDEHCLYKQEQGSVYKWPSRKSWHAGANCGLVSKYIFNVWG